MDTVRMRALFQSLGTGTVEETIRMTLAAISEPTSARKLWEFLLATSATDEHFHLALQLLLESVLVDQVNHRIVSDDEYALVIGRRVVTILEKMSQLTSSQQVQTA